MSFGKAGEASTLEVAIWLLSMSPIQRRVVWLAMKIMKSKAIRAFILFGWLAAIMIVVILSALFNVSPLLVWALILVGGATSLIVLLKMLKIL